MARLIEDYGLIGDGKTAALVNRNGSIDWLCWPRFDSDACFAALLGTEEHGRWLIEPVEEAKLDRRYQTDTLVLETDFETREQCRSFDRFHASRRSILRVGAAYHWTARHHAHAHGPESSVRLWIHATLARMSRARTRSPCRTGPHHLAIACRPQLRARSGHGKL